MDAEQIGGLRPQLLAFLAEFDDCFGRRDTRAHFPKYVEGQLSDLPRKSVEPLALKAGVPVRTLQEFLSQHQWNNERMRDRLQQLVMRDHSGKHSIGLIDETSFVKKGAKTPGVQRQHCGAVGKQENCIVTVHLGYACDDFHCLIDDDLFVPESWSQDRARCREAGIPDDVVYRPKSEIALELHARATHNGVCFEWLTFDEWYGSKPEFLRTLDRRGQKFVGEVHKHFSAWLKAPTVTTRSYRKGGRGRGRATPRLLAGSPGPRHVEDLLRDPALQSQAWQRWRVKDGEKGPMIWEVKHTLVYVKDERGLPETKPWHLLIARNVEHPDEIKYFVSNAPAATSVSDLLLVAFARWRIERLFEDEKGEIGLDHYEGRRWLGLRRHLTLSNVSYLFLARTHQRLREKKSGVDALPGSYGCVRRGTLVVAR
jgi:SRSO17 transposase